MSRCTSDHAHYLTLLSIPGIGARTLTALLRVLPSWMAVWDADDRTLMDAGLTPRQCSLLHQHTPPSDPEALLAPYNALDIAIVDLRHPHYPPLLTQVTDAPAALFVRGDTASLAHTPLVTIVGSRDYSDYGRQAATTLTSTIAAAGVGVVSGLALGIDGIAHRAALDAGGITIAVVGSTLAPDALYPRQHAPLADAIVRGGGVIVSEYPLGTATGAFMFPARNRIMAAMAHATLVVEATEGSGTLITARQAVEYGRDVLAVPGSIFSPRSIGTHALIAQGAAIVGSAAQILATLPSTARGSTTQTTLFATVPEDLSDDARRILTVMAGDTLHVDKIITMSKLETTTTLATLALLEIRGLVRDVGGKNYLRT